MTNLKDDYLEKSEWVVIERASRWIKLWRIHLQWRRHRRCRFHAWVREIPWRRKWKPIAVFLLGESHRQRSLVGYSPWGHKKLDPTEFHDRNQKLWGQRPKYAFYVLTRKGNMSKNLKKKKKRVRMHGVFSNN